MRLINANRYLEVCSNPPSFTEVHITLFNGNCTHLKINAKPFSTFYNQRLSLSPQAPAHLAETSILEQDHWLPSASTCFSASVSQRDQQLASPQIINSQYLEKGEMSAPCTKEK